MATERVEDDEYGVEVIRAPDTQAVEETKATAQAQPTAAAVKPTAATAPAANASAAAVQTDDDDEEDMYGEGVDIAAAQEENDGFQIEEGK